MLCERQGEALNYKDSFLFTSSFCLLYEAFYNRSVWDACQEEWKMSKLGKFRDATYINETINDFNIKLFIIK